MKILTRHEEHVLLTVLRLQDNAYLVTIREQIKELTGKDLSFGTLYVSLKRLETQGYLRPEIGDPTAKRGGKAIKYYRLSEDGIQALKAVQKLNDSLWVDFPDLAYKV